MTKITYPKDAAAALRGADELLVLAPKAAFDSGWPKKALPEAVARRIGPIVKDAKPGDLGWTGSSVEDASPARIVAGVLPDEVSRHNSPTRLEAVLKCTRSAALGRGRKAVVALVEHPELVAGTFAGVWRAFPLYDRKRSEDGKRRVDSLALLACGPDGSPIAADKTVRATVEAGRWAAQAVDTPTADMTTAVFVTRARSFVKDLPDTTVRVISTDGLVKEGLMGIHSVGRTAKVGPRMLLLDHRPARAKRTVALVGKGVVYDTGGLNLKTGGIMSTMKCDMAGAAAVVGAFRVLASTGCPHRVVAAAPLAENAIGPDSYRPDDILEMHSGLTVEINNTDAEGRLLLADAVSYVARKHDPDAIVDAATLTGAQLVSTGYRHAAIVSNREGLQRLAFESGRTTGDLAWPLPFAPEFHMQEFKSKVADMKNSVKNRMNAQSACAAQFVYRHIKELDVPWLHIDLAGPAFRDERATGYGVLLMSRIVSDLDDGALAE